MRAHDERLADIGVKKGPRILILKHLSSILLPGEDEQVKNLLELSKMGKYRANFAEEQIDIIALRCFKEQNDEVIKNELGIKESDMPLFLDMLSQVSP